MKLTILKLMLLPALTLSFFAFVCGDSKNETNTNQNQTNTQTQQQNTQTQNTQKKTDSMTTKTDSTDTKDKKDSKESNIVVMKTSMGEIEIELLEKDAPLHVANFKKLVKSGFYEGTTFHRVIAGFMIQGGDPNSKDADRTNDGQGGPGYTIPAEIKAKHEKGSLAGARLGDAVNPKRESSGSQFYIVTGEASHLDGQYTVYGKVIKGMDIAFKIEKVKTDAMDNPVEKVTIQKVSFK
ncbi:MAG: peptidyl-prolyl cis-trans isomerase A [Chlorobi bacterium OLB5]|nr:MAG: peptidyl-prolyl cis-trans isomerase A [Chlorobi bacterium OLB5]